MGYSPWGHKRVRHGLATKQQWIVLAFTKYLGLSSQGALMRWVPIELKWPFTQRSNFCSCQLIPPLACNGLFVLSLRAVLWHVLQEALKGTTFCLTDISSEHHTCQDSSRCRVLRHTLGWGLNTCGGWKRHLIKQVGVSKSQSLSTHVFHPSYFSRWKTLEVSHQHTNQLKIYRCLTNEWKACLPTYPCNSHKWCFSPQWKI